MNLTPGSVLPKKTDRLGLVLLLLFFNMNVQAQIQFTTVSVLGD